MATGTVADERRERERELARARDELEAAMAKYASAEVAASSADCPESHPALVDQRLRRAAVSVARQGLQAAYGSDRSDGAARACAACGGRMRRTDREAPSVETMAGRVRVSMARHACAACGTTVRPRERELTIEGSTTPSARRMASVAGSSACHAEADRLLQELAGANFGTKARRGDAASSARRAWWAAALSGARSAASADGGGGAPARKPVLWVRCARLSGRFDDYWDDLSRRLTTKTTCVRSMTSPELFAVSRRAGTPRAQTSW